MFSRPIFATPQIARQKLDGSTTPMTDELTQLDIPYGRNGRFTAQVLSKRTLKHYQPHANVADIASALRDAFSSPLEFPQLKQACVPDDRVVIALDRSTPRADAVVMMIWKQLSEAGIRPENVIILQAGSWHPAQADDPRALLPSDVKASIQVKQHDPTNQDECAYLASTAAGDRIYLAKEIVDADLVIPVGPARFDPLLGHHGEASVLYPAFSDLDTIKRFIGYGHDELSPSEDRPLRQQVDEVGWLLGTQFVVTIVPGRGDGIEKVVAGLAEAVSKSVKKQLQSESSFQVGERAELVVVAVEADASGHTWEQVASVIDMARRLVERDGKIVVLSQLHEDRGPGLEMLSQVRTPGDALKQIRKSQPPDYLAATRIARAVEWANVYLLSDLPAASLEDLFIIPVETPVEAQKLLQGDDALIVVESAQKVYASCR